MKRSAGVLMHITSLPSNYGIGTLGKKAYDFADFLKESGQGYWQILPIGPTGYGNSPYTSYSTFAGNMLLIDLDLLIEKNLLNENYVNSFDWGSDPACVDYDKMLLNKDIVLRKAFENFKKFNQSEFLEFAEKNETWLDDYAVYMTARKFYGDISWEEWPNKALSLYEKTAIDQFNAENKDEISYWKFIQFLFFTQWFELKNYCNKQGIKIIGDIPIYVPLDSSDVWANSKCFCLDEDKKPTCISGCPPDAFSPTGQLWGHPIYNWNYMKNDDYAWWMLRIQWLSNLFDVTRIDHFRGFDTYYSIPNDGKKDAVSRGKWCNGPGYEFFEVLKEKFEDSVEIIAEDLGTMTKSVEKLLKKTGFPGMKVLLLTFDSRDESVVRPHDFTSNYVIYTGTHDNDTVMGWLKYADKTDVDFATNYLHITKDEDYNWGMIRGAYQSVCNLAIIPMQDLLGLGTDARMNTPSTVGHNWQWRLKKDIDLKNVTKKLKELCKIYER